MAQIVNAGFQQLQSPYGDLAGIAGQAASQGVTTAFNAGMLQRERQNLQGLQAQAAMLEQKYPTSQGGIARALNQANTAQAAQADLLAYYDALGRATGRKISAQEVAQGIQGFAQGFIAPQNLVNASGELLLRGGPEGQAQPVPAPVPAQPIQSGLVPVGQGPGTQTGPALAPRQAQVAPQAPQPQGPASTPYQRAPYPEGPNYAPQAQVAPPQAVMQMGASVPESAYMRQPGDDVPWDVQIRQQEAQKARDAAMNARGRAGQIPFTPGAGRPTAQAASPFQLGASMIDVLTSDKFELSPEDAAVAASQVSIKTPDGQTAVPIGPNKSVALAPEDLKRASGTAKTIVKFWDQAYKDAASGKTSDIARAVDQAATVTPGMKEFTREWAGDMFQKLRTASPQELVALGLDEKAKTIIDSDKNRLLAEQNWSSFVNQMARNGIDLAQIQAEYDKARLDFFARVSASTGTAEGIKTSSILKALELVEPAARAYATEKGKFDQKKYVEFFQSQGFEGLTDFVSGLTGGKGGVRFAEDPNKYNPFDMGSTLYALPPSQLGPTGQTPAAAAGTEASGFAGGGAMPPDAQAAYLQRITAQSAPARNFTAEAAANSQRLYENMMRIYGGQ